MTREELIALRDAIDITLTLPDSIRELLAQWLAPAAAPIGHDPHPPAPTPPPKAAPTPRPAASKPYDNPTHARAAERKLLAAMREHPGLSAALLAKAVGAGLATTKERLRRMGAQELIEKAPDGRWQVKRGGAARHGRRGEPSAAVAELTAAAEPEPVKPEGAFRRWVRPLGEYERRETTIAEGLRYG